MPQETSLSQSSGQSQRPLESLLRLRKTEIFQRYQHCCLRNVQLPVELSLLGTVCCGERNHFSQRQTWVITPEPAISGALGRWPRL